MRAVLLILIVAVVVVIVAVGSNLVDIRQTRGAKVPKVDATGNGIVASGGQAPAFDVETGSVQVGTAPTNVNLPRIQVQPPGNTQATQPEAQPQPQTQPPPPPTKPAGQ